MITCPVCNEYKKYFDITLSCKDSTFLCPNNCFYIEYSYEEVKYFLYSYDELIIYYYSGLFIINGECIYISAPELKPVKTFNQEFIIFLEKIKKYMVII